MSLGLPKKTLAIFSLTSCEGCCLELLSFYEHFEKLQNFYDIQNFKFSREENLLRSFDVALVEGNPDSEKQIKLLKNIRKNTKVVVAIGACAHLGGIQSERNRLSQKLVAKHSAQNVPDTIRTDYIVPGCPVSHSELLHCLMDIYWGKVFTLSDLAVCFECRQNSNKCLIKEGKPCLGPITRAGCNSICVNNKEACLGCRGPLKQANFEKLKEILATMLDEDELQNWLTVYGDYEKEHKE